jgi:cell division inhibitor SepF
MGVAQAWQDVRDRFRHDADDLDQDDEAYEQALQEEEHRRLRRLEGEEPGAGAGFDEIYAEEPLRREQNVRALHLVSPPQLRFAVQAPRSFEEAQQIADEFRKGSCVSVDLQDCEPQLARRLIDFCSGLAYALDGGLLFVERDVLVLAPHHIELAEGATSRRGGFYNQL